MRIAQVAPLAESVPPLRYGGTERIVSYLTEELVALGHDVTLFASGDSTTRANLVAPCERSLRLGAALDRIAPHVLMLEWVAQQAHEFDVVHFHIDYLHFPLVRRHRLTHVTTLHGRQDLPELPGIYREFSDMPLISISHSQRAPLPHARWAANVYHGLPHDLYRLHEQPGEYLVFLGRVSPEKGIDRAIEIARRSGIPLKIAAKVDDADRAYFEQQIAPQLDDPLVEFLGEVDDAAKDELLGNAIALLFPISWPEPFGMVMIEALACGTPVIAFPCGSVPEVLDHGVTGLIVQDIDEAVEAVREVRHLDRRRCREVFEERFTSRRMAEDYVQVYEMMAGQPAQPPFRIGVDGLELDAPSIHATGWPARESHEPRGAATS